MKQLGPHIPQHFRVSPGFCPSRAGSRAELKGVGRMLRPYWEGLGGGDALARPRGLPAVGLTQIQTHL